MIKLVKVPAYSGLHSEFFLQELVANHHIVNKVLVVWQTLIWCDPATVSKLKSALFYHLFNILLHLRCLPFVPHLKEDDLTISKDPILLDGHLLNDISQYGLNRLLPPNIVCSREVLIKSLPPTSIVMRMRNEMDIELLFWVLSLQKTLRISWMEMV